MSKKLVKTIFATTSILVGAALSTASPSEAVTSSVELNSYTPSEITKVGVNSSGTAYEIKGLMDLTAEVRVVVDGGVVAHVKNWKTWLLVRTENSTWVEFSDDGVSESYPFLQRPQKVDVAVPLAVPHMTLVPVMVSYCNALADDLRAQGKSNTEIFSQDRTVPIALRVYISEKFIPGYNALHQSYPNTGDISDWQKINLICKGRVPVPPVNTAGDIKPPPVDFKVQDIDLFLTTFSGANTQPNAATSCKKGQIKVRLKASKAGPAKFKLWTKVGAAPMTSKVIDAWASFDGAGGYKAEHVEWVSVDKTSTLQAKAEEMVGLGLSTPWKDLTLQCMDAGGGGIATNPNTSNPDNDIPQGKNVDGDFAFIDHGSPKCERTGKALITFRSPKSDNIHYSLDCKFDNHSGVLPTVPHPDGGYTAAALVSFDVNTTYTEACTLRTVAPYGPEDHVNKTHLFQCVTTSGHSASNDVQVDSNPPSSKPDVPAKLVVGTGTQNAPSAPWQCIGGTVQGHNGCVCPPHKKLIYTQVMDHGQLFSGSKCVLSGPSDKTTKPASSSTDTAGTVKADAVKRRLEAAKQATIAKRKRNAAAAKTLKLKAAKSLTRKAAIAKRKRAAAKMVAVKKAAAALRIRKARALKAAAVKRATAAAFVRRKATLRKRTAPSSASIGTTMRRRALRRR